jgi:hypothetical protein
MKKYIQFGMLLFAVLCYTIAMASNDPEFSAPVEGRWDLTVNMGGGRIAASWLEVRHSGVNGLTGRFVGDGGSARPISSVSFKEGKVSFHIPAQWEKTDREMIFEGNYKDDKLEGTIINTLGKTYTFTGVRAPKLIREKAPVWGSPIHLFNGKNLEGWMPLGKNNQWVVENGILKSPQSGVNIRTTKTFDDFKLHIEFRYPKESNSGVYLRGRYEVQVEDSKGKEPINIYLGGVYGFIDPLWMMAKEAGEWQSYDITLVGRLVTVVVNGKKVIEQQPIPGVTGGALDANESEPGPIMMQGDHGPIEYRNIILTPARK